MVSPKVWCDRDTNVLAVDSSLSTAMLGEDNWNSYVKQKSKEKDLGRVIFASSRLIFPRDGVSNC